MSLVLPIRTALAYGYRDPTLTFDCDFTRGDLNTGTILGPSITFTRASSGTYFDNQKVLQTAGSNVARFGHDPATGAPLGLLIEEARANLMLQSEDADNVVHSKVRVTVDKNTIAAPDGNITMDSVLETAVTNTFHLDYDITNVSGSTAHTWSIFVKKLNTRRYVQLQCLENGGSSFQTKAVFDFNTGAFTDVLTDDSGTQALFVEDVGGGIFRIGQSFTTEANTTGIIPQIWIADADEDNSNHVGAADEGVYAWGAQVEAGAFPTSYIATAGSSVTRAADVAITTDMSWFNPTQGTIFAEYELVQAASTDIVIQISDSGFTNSLEIWANESGGPEVVYREGGSTRWQQLIGGASDSNPGIHQIAYAYKAGSLAAIKNAATGLQTSSYGTMGTGHTEATFCMTYDGFNQINGYLRKLRYWRERKANQFLATLVGEAL